ncbi:hypothetical protein BH11ACT3_BH11ACT3_19390 [soil metagenome]
MPDWLTSTVAVIQLFLNGAAVVGGAIVWKLYVDNLKAASDVKDATIQNVEKSRDFWKEKAQEFEKRSPEVVEKSLAERIQIRDAEILRIKADQEFDKLALRTLEIDKASLEQDLFRTQGFRAMLALEEGYEHEGDDPKESEESDLAAGSELELVPEDPPNSIEVVYIGEVGVDSGQLMVTDPSYIDREWKRDKFELTRVEGPIDEEALYNYSYNGACNATMNGGGHGQLAFELGHAGAGVAFHTAWGDGAYAVYAEKHDGRIVRVYVNVG